MPEPVFRKCLVARYSPKNRCFAGDGELLYAIPLRESLRTVGRSVKFTGIGDGAKTSKFGWVASVAEEFTAREFVERHLKRGVSEEQMDALVRLFRSISEYDDGAPVAADYARRGIEPPTVELVFHKVILYAVNSTTANRAERLVKAKGSPGTDVG